MPSDIKYTPSGSQRLLYRIPNRHSKCSVQSDGSPTHFKHPSPESPLPRPGPCHKASAHHICKSTSPALAPESSWHWGVGLMGSCLHAPKDSEFKCLQAVIKMTICNLWQSAKSCISALSEMGAAQNSHSRLCTSTSLLTPRKRREKNHAWESGKSGPSSFGLSSNSAVLSSHHKFQDLRNSFHHLSAVLGLGTSQLTGS